MNVHILHSEPGPHEGWTDTYFAQGGSCWRLRTIDDVEPRSHISPAVQTPGGWIYISGQTRVFECVLTPDAAYQILVQIDTVRDEAFEAGKVAAQKAIRASLGI